MKKSYVFAGASQRGLGMYVLPMKERYADYCELRGVYDINPGRAQYVAQQGGMPAFDDFDTMIKQTKPDIVIVTTVDAYHSDYIIRAMELGCDVITEKPMTTDAQKCRAIMEAEKRTGKNVVVTFNCRYSPFMTKIRELIARGDIGDIFSVHFEWMLDCNPAVLGHGASYFHRWNARMEKSGGLLVHKSTHHFDLVNWWIGQAPVQVSAFGKLRLYGQNGSRQYAGGIEGPYCRKCTHTDECAFYRRLSERDTEFYVKNEHYDGYHKDGCVYAQDIDIYDTMSLNVLYDGGAMMSYSLNATAAYEGWRIAINGSAGRLEAYKPSSGPDDVGNAHVIRVFDMHNNVTEHRITRADGGHDGGDERLLRMLFVGDQPDPYGLAAGSVAGAHSLLIGAAANVSIRENRMVDIGSLLGDASLLGR